MTSVAAWWNHTRELPVPLQVLCRGGMVLGPLLLLAILLPLGTYQIHGGDVSWSEFWSSGAGPAVGAVLLLVSAGCWGLAARWRSGRWLLVVAPLLLLVTLALFGELSQSAWDILLVALLIGLSAVTYVSLFHTRTVRDYLASGVDPAQHARRAVRPEA